MKVISHRVQGSRAPVTISLCADGRHDAWLEESYPRYLGVSYGAHAGECVVCEGPDWCSHCPRGPGENHHAGYSCEDKP